MALTVFTIMSDARPDYEHLMRSRIIEFYPSEAELWWNRLIPHIVNDNSKA